MDFNTSHMTVDIGFQLQSVKEIPQIIKLQVYGMSYLIQVSFI